MENVKLVNREFKGVWGSCASSTG